MNIHEGGSCCSPLSRAIQKRNDVIIHTALQKILAIAALPRPQGPIGRHAYRQASRGYPRIPQPESAPRGFAQPWRRSRGRVAPRALFFWFCARQLRISVRTMITVTR
jgi:hypothetical protein